MHAWPHPLLFLTNYYRYNLSHKQAVNNSAHLVSQLKVAWVTVGNIKYFIFGLVYKTFFHLKWTGFLSSY